MVQFKKFEKRFVEVNMRRRRLYLLLPHHHPSPVTTSSIGLWLTVVMLTKLIRFMILKRKRKETYLLLNDASYP